MSRDGLEFRVTGPDAQDAAEELAALFDEDFQDWPRTVHGLPGPASESRTKGDQALLIVAVILAAPPAIKNTWDLAIRIKASRMAERLIEWARKRAARKAAATPITVTLGARSIPLEAARTEEIVNALAELVDAGAGGKDVP